MSRVGKYPVPVPSGVTVQIAGTEFIAKGKLGESRMPLSDEVETTIEGSEVWVKPKSDSKRARMMWGTTRALINNLVKGVSDGFTVNLDINGVGYRAAVEGKNLKLALGYSHDIDYPIPDDVTMKCEKPTSISITGRDKQIVGQLAAEIRSFRGPEPYKGKGIKYSTETILRKEGKKK
ncbi:50S ribosomal protein L6 [Magnetospirillum gryphiswaldense]|uniref:Large ribosomal subunit protein uL6 n=2 Tax=Magnetospirillum gryphiswaldense TaxID=55518 RepID=V6EYI8_MAGGM|nr:50S ribosomal protein L6 [Magnetospirillum gryphiswaldense]AVM72593.1 50S ribosomal protein L6 [Magnetospirillum gryphiswaldense MSR-1]AVM76496.1 50S ribosomal protein L6 [Magnetospirillum gryphiswaldense]CAM77763.1 50S ribosomal protein L6 [Magnetospirillum gryphiswaldense MSR-1]CDK97268.1 50S ribosomal subunit protein L6 [Magnetospirillum gryphiswaldense MSR-1 v2]